MRRHREAPIPRVNPSGEKVWMARYTGADGRRRSAGTFKLKRDAQDAIEAAYGRRDRVDTLHAYFKTWTTRHPRSKRTNETNEGRIRQLLDVSVDGIPLRDWPLHELRRRHALELVDHMLRAQGRATTGAQNILRSLSAMAEDAITDEVTDINPFRGVKVRATDPRAIKPRRRKRVFTFEQMHAFAAAASVYVNERTNPRPVPAPTYEALMRIAADTGMRIGEFLALRRTDLVDTVFHISRTTHEGEFEDGTKNDHGEQVAARLVPCPPGLFELIRRMPPRIDIDLLFPTPKGCVWRESNFRRDVWKPTQEASGLDIQPHEMRHSWITHLRAAGIDDADLAKAAGHSLRTMHATYAHALDRSFEAIRVAIG